MQRERQTILSLVALGRITPREAERLLAAWNESRDELWLIAGCLTAWQGQFLPSLERLAHTLLPGGLPGLHHTVTAITYWMGGVL